MKKFFGKIIFLITLYVTSFLFVSNINKILDYQIVKGNKYLISLYVSVAIFLFIWILTIGKKRSDGTYKDKEHGSAKWEEEKEYKKIADDKFENNILVSKNVRYSLNNIKKNRLNNHMCIYGDSGSGKSRYYVKPNVLQMNGSYIITDPKGEHIADEGCMLRKGGYDVKCFDVKEFKGMKFNPLKYFVKESEVSNFVSILIENTTGSDDAQAKQDFWVKAERLWLMAMISYIRETCPPEECTIPSLSYMCNLCSVSEDEEKIDVPDLLFEELEEKNPNSFAVKQYKKYKKSAGKTARSILISVGVRLSPWDIPEVAEMFSKDELNLEEIGYKKQALFLIMSDIDNTYSYLVNMVISATIICLVRKADKERKKRLPINVRFIIDEIANIGRIPNLERYIAVLRSRAIGIEMIWQDYSQGKLVYGKAWSTIESNCGCILFLGGQGPETAKYVSEELLGKTTTFVDNYNYSRNSRGIGISSSSDGESKIGRYLMDKNEVKNLEFEYCIIKIKGLNPILDYKIETEKHKNYKLLADFDENNFFDYEEEFSKVS